MDINLNNKEKNWIKLGLLWLGMFAAIKIAAVVQVPLIAVNVLFVGMSFALVAKGFCNNQENKWEMIVFIASFILHLLLMIVDLYGTDYITILHSGKDTEAFYMVSKQYYYGDFSETITYYPYFLNAFYKVIGLNRFGAQYVNVLCWCFGMILMEKSCQVLEIKGKLRFCTLLLFAFAPNYLCVTSILLREGIIILMNLLWFYCQVKWMKEGKHIYLTGCLLAPLVSLALHMSAIVFWGLTILIIALYDAQKKELRIQKKTLMIILIGIVGILIFMLIPSTRRLITRKLPDFDEGFLNTINEMIAVTSDNSGGSSYLQHVYVNGYGDFIWQTFMRIFYFYGAPLPMNWRGLADIAAFMISSSLYLVSILVSIGSVFVKKKDAVRTLMWGAFLTLGGISCWGVFNGATAMRHRDKIIGVCILLLLYSIKITNEAWKSRRKT